MKSELLNVLRRYLRPEFINRIDEIIVFHALDRKQIRDIVGLQLERVKRIAHGQGLTVEFDNSLIDHLADVGYRPEFGARERRRQIRSLIETRLASAVLRGDIEEGDSLRFVYDDDRSEIRWEKEAKVPRVYLRVVGYSAIITPLSISASQSAATALHWLAQMGSDTSSTAAVTVARSASETGTSLRE